MAKKPTKQEMEDWFQVIDADGSGKVDAKELKAVVKAFYEWQEMSVDDAKLEADVAAIMKEVDTSGDGKIDKAEFFKYLAGV